ncbi:GSU2403 family nucleotidyltransferase fold protein [Phyllobacterium myrsinacearum]|uniref:GSU2403 family nucleotidyltransferase fold protein n=1 Tax=Phyllobacterium myrsinacearum TaxID=28101 RepID=UPI0015FE44A4
MIIIQLRRQDDHRSAAKSRKDLEQARALIGVLAIQRPYDLKHLWQMPAEIVLAPGKM